MFKNTRNSRSYHLILSTRNDCKDFPIPNDNGTLHFDFPLRLQSHPAICNVISKYQSFAIMDVFKTIIDGFKMYDRSNRNALLTLLSERSRMDRLQEASRRTLKSIHAKFLSRWLSCNFKELKDLRTKTCTNKGRYHWSKQRKLPRRANSVYTPEPLRFVNRLM